MAQFHIHEDRKAKLYPLLLDVQADHPIVVVGSSAIDFVFRRS